MVAAREIMLMIHLSKDSSATVKQPRFMSAQAGHAQGMINMDKAIVKLVRNNTVTAQVALRNVITTTPCNLRLRR